MAVRKEEMGFWEDEKVGKAGQRVCAVEGCGRDYYSKEYCKLHYTRMHKHGDPLYEVPKKEKKYCSIEDCNKEHYCGELCRKHYDKARVRPALEQVTLTNNCKNCDKKFTYTRFNRFNIKTFCSKNCSEEYRFGDKRNRFYKNISFNENGCWDWTGLKDISGYGIFSWKGKLIKAHRFSYELHIGEIPKGLLCCHHCDRPECSSPFCLFIGTDKDNVQDMIKKGRKYIMRGDNHTNSKLTEEQVKQINLDLNNGISATEISKASNVHRATIMDIKDERTWRHIK